MQRQAGRTPEVDAHSSLKVTVYNLHIRVRMKIATWLIRNDIVIVLYFYLAFKQIIFNID